MPIYEYVCRSCGERFSEMRRLDARRDAAPCPGCRGEETALALSVPGHVGAGSGAATGAGGEACEMPGGCCGGTCMS